MIYLSIVKLIFSTPIHLLKVTIMKNVKPCLLLLFLAHCHLQASPLLKFSPPAGQRKSVLFLRMRGLT